MIGSKYFPYPHRHLTEATKVIIIFKIRNEKIETHRIKMAAIATKVSGIAPIATDAWTVDHLENMNQTKEAQRTNAIVVGLTKDTTTKERVTPMNGAEIILENGMHAVTIVQDQGHEADHNCYTHSVIYSHYYIKIHWLKLLWK